MLGLEGGGGGAVIICHQLRFTLHVLSVGLYLEYINLTPDEAAQGKEEPERQYEQPRE